MKVWPGIFITLVLLISSSVISTTGYAEEPGLQQTLGPAVDILQHPTLVEMARLKTVSVAESRKRALKATNRIAGYPISSELIVLNQTQQLATLLLDKNIYTDFRQRCQNQYFHGVRFSKGQEVIEIAIGVPCHQLVAVFHYGQETKWWGGVLGSEPAKQVLTLLEPK